MQQSNQLGSVEIVNVIGNLSSDTEIETIGMDNLNESDAKSSEKADNSKHPLVDDVLADQLDDFMENTDPVTTTQGNSTSRRRLRMVLDFDDEDD